MNNLKPSTAYVFQIRAFTTAGYGTYGPRLEVTTKEEASGTSRTHAWACTHKGTHVHTHKHTHTHTLITSYAVWNCVVCCLVSCLVMWHIKPGTVMT